MAAAPTIGKRVSFTLDASVDDDDDEDKAGSNSPTSPSFRARMGGLIRAASLAKHLVNKIRYTMPFGDLAMTQLMHACATGNLEKTKILLAELGGDRQALDVELAAADDWAGSSPLHWAACTRHPHLLRHGRPRASPLACACARADSGNAHIVQALLSVGAKVDLRNERDGSMAVHLAARYGKTDALVALVDDPVGRLHVNAPNDLGNTPLHECAYEGKAQGAEVLLSRGALLELYNAEEKGGLPPLLSAIEYGRLATVEVLLRAGASTTTAPLNARAIKHPLRNSVHAATAAALKRARNRSRPSLTRRHSTGSHMPDSSASRRPESPPSRIAKFHIRGEPAISLALSAGHLDVCLALLMFRSKPTRPRTLCSLPADRLNGQRYSARPRTLCSCRPSERPALLRTPSDPVLLPSV